MLLEREKIKGWVNWVVEGVAGGMSSRGGERIADFMWGTGESVLEFNTKFENLKRNLTLLNNVASDIEAQVKNELRGGRKKRKREVSEWLDEKGEIQLAIELLVREVENKSTSRFTYVDRMEKLNEKVNEHIKQSKGFGVLVLDDHGRGEKIFLGEMYGAVFRRNSDKIFSCVKDSNVKTVVIHGIPGAGKTTLAMHINNRVLDETEDHVYWVKVSEDADVKRLQDDLSHAIGITISGENNADFRASRLHLGLKQKRNFVLILDDLREAIKLEKVMGYPFEEDGYLLIVTTSSSSVCKHIDYQESVEIVEVKVEEDEAWDMFIEAYGQDTPFTLQEEEFARSAVNNRHGLPKQIVQLAKRMKKVDSSKWQHQLAELDESL